MMSYAASPLILVMSDLALGSFAGMPVYQVMRLKLATLNYVKIFALGVASLRCIWPCNMAITKYMIKKHS